jgi:hypothetical protein
VIVGKADAADHSKKRAVVGAPALELDLTELVAGDQERMVGASVRGAARLPGVRADLARVHFTLAQSAHEIGNTVARHHATYLCPGNETASYSAITAPRHTRSIARSHDRQSCIGNEIASYPRAYADCAAFEAIASAHHQE